MPNPDTPRGLVPLRNLSGTPYNGATNVYSTAASSGAEIYVGSLVKLSGTADAGGIAGVTGNVATGDAVIGVCTSVVPVTASSPMYRLASTESYVNVADDPNLVFEVQEDSTGGALAATRVGMVADLSSLLTGSVVTGKSTMTLDSSTATATGDGTEDVLILGLSQRSDNEIGTHAKWLVRLNNHAFVDGNAGT